VAGRGRAEEGKGGHQMEVIEEGEGLIILGPPYVLGAKEVDESVLFLSLPPVSASRQKHCFSPSLFLSVPFAGRLSCPAWKVNLQNGRALLNGFNQGTGGE